MAALGLVMAALLVVLVNESAWRPQRKALPSPTAPRRTPRPLRGVQHTTGTDTKAPFPDPASVGASVRAHAQSAPPAASTRGPLTPARSHTRHTPPPLPPLTHVPSTRQPTPSTLPATRPQPPQTTPHAALADPSLVLGHPQGKPKQLAALAELFPLGSRCNPFTPTPPPVAAEVAARHGVIKLDCHGQWGNRLGEYVAARAAAESLNFGLEICDILKEELLSKGSIFPDVGDVPFDHTLLERLPWVQYKGHTYPWRELLADPTPRVLHFDGYPFRDYTVFRKHRTDIRERWLRIAPDCIVGWHQQRPGPRDIVVHVRAYHGCGPESADVAYVPTAQFVDPPWEYYARILDRYRAPGGGGWDTLWMTCMCGMNHNMTQALARVYGARLAPGAAHHADTSDWLFMRDAPRLIMSQSTFAWWAAWLGDATEVHYPLVGDWWGKNPRHALFPEESRFIFHDLIAGRWFLQRDEIGPPG